MDNKVILELEQYLQTYYVADTISIHENMHSVSHAIPQPPAPLHQREKVLNKSVNLRENISDKSVNLDINLVEEISFSEIVSTVNNKSLQADINPDLRKKTEQGTNQIKRTSLKEESINPNKPSISGFLKLSKKNGAEIQKNDIEEYIRKTKIEDTFSTRLLKYIDQSDVSDSQIYKKAGLDRKHFSKIRCDVNYRPKKTTVLALCLALELDLEKIEELLELAGYSLSNNDTGDLIVKFCVEKGIYDLMDVNEAFVYFGVKAIGVI